MNSKIKCIPVLSFFFTCIFVIYHVSFYGTPLNQTDSTVNQWMTGLNGRLAEIALSYFFGVTGFLLFKNMNSIKACLIKIKRRVFSLLVPYLFWQFLVLGIFYLTHKYSGGEMFTNCLRTIFLFDGYPPDIPLWYIYAAFAWALLSPLLMLLFRNKKIGFPALIVLFAILYFVMNDPSCAAVNKYGLVWLTLKYSFAYLAGAFYGLHSPDREDKDSLKYIAFALIVCFAISVLQLDDIKTSVLMASFPILLIKFFPEKLCKERKLYHISFLIFAIHYPIYQYSLDALKNVQLSGIPVSAVNILFRAAVLAISIALSYALYLLLSRFAPKVLSLITGGRV